MKPMPVAIKYFTNEIVKRASKSFAKSELNKDEFDKIIKSVEEINNVVNNAKKEGNSNGDESNKES